MFWRKKNEDRRLDKETFPVSEEQLMAYRQATMHDLQKAYGLNPVYLDMDADEINQLSADELPLFYVSGQSDKGDSWDFTMGVNQEKFRQALVKHMNEHDPYFQETWEGMVREWGQLVGNAILASVAKTGASPRMVCEGAALEM